MDTWGGLLHLSPVSWTVLQVVEALRPHGLTLQNFASIREQAIGGFVQVGLPTCMCPQCLSVRDHRLIMSTMYAVS